jgi:hypothetical protein
MDSPQALTLAELVGEGAVSQLPGSSFFEFYQKVKGRPPVETLPYEIIGLDPGETTGVSVWTRTGSEFQVQSFQINTSIIEWGVDKFNILLQRSPGKCVVIENYRVYSWKAKIHSWQELLTPRLIGVAETFCRLGSIPIVKQMAQQGKSFATDDKLEQWGLYLKGRPHAMDATRHVCQLLLFGEWK